MMKRREKLFMGFVISLVVVLFFSAKAMAVPTFGVATSSGTYLENPGEPPDASQAGYIDWFLARYPGGDGYVSGGGHGFLFDGSTDTLTVFTNEANVDVWLLHEESFRNNDVTFAGGAFGSFLMSGPGPGGQIDGYTDKPYWGLNLGRVDTSAGWVELPSNSSSPTGPFNPGPFYAYTGQLNFGNALTIDDLGHYFFSVGNVDGSIKDGIETITGGEFSPKTTSAQYNETPIPEPTTIALLGIGLVGLVGGAVRRKFKKNN